MGKVEAWEAGFETNLLRNRLHFEGVYYKKNTKDLLAEVPGISGTIPGIGNLGEIQNKGVEMAVTWRDQIGDWGYSVSANLTTIKNEVKVLFRKDIPSLPEISSKVTQWQVILSDISMVTKWQAFISHKQILTHHPKYTGYRYPR